MRQIVWPERYAFTEGPSDLQIQFQKLGDWPAVFYNYWIELVTKKNFLETKIVNEYWFSEEAGKLWLKFAK